MANNKTPLQALFEKGDLPGVTQADVVNQAHPGYIGPIPEDQLPRNLFQEQYDANMHNFGIDEEMLFDIATGSGAPMAIGSVAKGGKSLLNSLLKKLSKGKKATESEKKLIQEAFDLEVDRIDNAITLQKAKKAGEIGPEITLDEFMKKYKDWRPRSKGGQENIKSIKDDGWDEYMEDLYHGPGPRWWPKSKKDI